MSKAKNCDECQHSYTRDWDLRLYCNKGHKPRYYAPKTISEALRANFGWKRTCEDFQIHPLQALADQAQELEIE